MITAREFGSYLKEKATQAAVTAMQINVLTEEINAQKRLLYEAADVYNRSNHSEIYATIDEKIDDSNRRILETSWDIALGVQKNAEKKSMLPFDSAMDINEETVTERIKKSYGFLSFYHQGFIFMKLKMLPSKFNKKSDYCSQIGRPLEGYIRSFIRINDVNVENFVKKTIFFLFCYPASASTAMIMDSDNHDTKNVVDAICSVFPGGDTGLLTKIILSTVQTDDVPEGTYVTVLPDMNCSVQDDEVVSHWKDYFTLVNA